MTSLRFISGKAALGNYLQGMRIDADRRLDARKLNASGRLKASNATEIRESGDVVTGSFTALDYWKTGGGSGSPPGTVADLEGLKEWVIIRKMVGPVETPDFLAERIQDRIYEDGSKYFRDRRDNEYANAVEAAQPGVNAVLGAFLSDIANPVADQFSKAFKAA